MFENEKKVLESVLAEFNKEQLETILLYNSVSFGKVHWEQTIKHTEEIHEKTLEKEQNSVKVSDYHLEAVKNSFRPHKMYPTDVFYSVSDKKYVCHLPRMYNDGEDEDIEETAEILVYGDTPAQACDNFDHQWIHGSTDDV
jgi:hypothetical protein